MLTCACVWCLQFKPFSPAWFSMSECKIMNIDQMSCVHPAVMLPVAKIETMAFSSIYFSPLRFDRL